MKKILMLFTGGTIASVKTERGLEPLLTAEQMFQYLSDVRRDVQLSSIQVCNLDSTLDYELAIETAHYYDLDRETAARGIRAISEEVRDSWGAGSQ